MAAMLTYLSNFFSGQVDSLWPHVVLLTGSVLASFAVGGGIIFESPKYSERVHRIATKLVIAGVVVEAVCTIVLFVFDEGISSKQQSTIEAQQEKIIALEMALSPRGIDEKKIAEDLKSFSNIAVVVRSISEMEPRRTAGQITATLRMHAGWQKYTGTLPEWAMASTFRDGVTVSADSGLGSGPGWAAAKALVAVLNANGIVAQTGSPVTVGMNAVFVAVGLKPLPPELRDKIGGTIMFE